MSMIKKYIITGLTLMNAAFGCLSILAAISGDYYLSAEYIVFAIISDQLDGRVARMLKRTSDFGRELDSLADAISFGVAPTVILYEMYLGSLGTVGTIIALLPALCAIHRLAKFNLTEARDHFIGVPTPANAGFVLSLVIGNVQVPAIYVAVMAVVISGLMVSKIPYYNFKNFKKLSKGEKVIIFAEIIVLLYGLAVYQSLVVIMMIMTYLVSSPFVFLFERART